MAEWADPRLRIQYESDPNLSLDEHMENIRDLLVMVDPTTGYIEGD